MSTNTNHPLIMGATKLTEREQAYCQCVVHGAAKQPGGCNLENAWFEMRDGRECYNPYAVCASSVGASTRKCYENYNYNGMRDDELI